MTTSEEKKLPSFPNNIYDIAIDEERRAKYRVMHHRKQRSLLLYLSTDLESCVDQVDLESVQHCGPTGHGFGDGSGEYEFIMYVKNREIDSKKEKAARIAHRSASLAPPSPAAEKEGVKEYSFYCRSEEELKKCVDSILLWVDYSRRRAARKSAKKDESSVLQDLQKRLDRRAGDALRRDNKRLTQQVDFAHHEAEEVKRKLTSIEKSQKSELIKSPGASERETNAHVQKQACSHCKSKDELIMSLEKENELLQIELRALKKQLDSTDSLQEQLDESRTENELLLEELAKFTLENDETD